MAQAAGPAPAATATPAPSPTPTATATPEPTATATPTATPTPTPLPQAVQLTASGCCTQPFWSPDSSEIRFIDRPSETSPAGIWGVRLDQPLAEPVLVSERIELSTALPDYLIDIDGATTTIERLADGERWTVPAQGRTVRISPDRSRIAWSITNADLEPERQVAAIWVANLDGSDARQVATLPRGGVSGWISNDVLLVSGRESLQAQEQTLSALSLADGATTELARAERLRGQVLSPSGQWIVYYTTFDADPANNGMWLVRTDGSERRQLDRGVFGAYQWRGCPGACGPEDDRLLIVPFDPEAAYHRLVEVNPATGDTRPLTDPGVTPFKIANGDWRVSPDGQQVVFVESSDRNIWVIELPR
jgi:Tol biopolymer transport system component